MKPRQYYHKSTGIENEIQCYIFQDPVFYQYILEQLVLQKPFQLLRVQYKNRKILIFESKNRTMSIRDRNHNDISMQHRYDQKWLRIHNRVQLLILYQIAAQLNLLFSFYCGILSNINFYSFLIQFQKQYNTIRKNIDNPNKFQNFLQYYSIPYILCLFLKQLILQIFVLLNQLMLAI